MDAELVKDLLQKAEEVRNDPRRFGGYRDDPVGFSRDILGVTLWEKQRDILKSMISHPRIAVRAGHSVGKTMALACAALWWLYAREGLVVTTATTWDQVEQVLWREINELARKARVFLPGEEGLTQRKVAPGWYAVGLSTNQPSAFQGRHHPRLLVIIDEAAGVNEQVHTEISTLATDPSNCVVMIGNPTAMSGTFYEAFKKPNVWKSFRISCLDHPNVQTGEQLIPGAVSRYWVEGRRQAWSENHPFWFSRVLGEFPKISVKGVIPLGWVERAQNEEKRLQALEEAIKERLPRIAGLDVARYGDNQCVLTLRRGDAIEWQECWHHTSLMETTGRSMKAIQDYGIKSLIVDAAGLGAGVVDRLIELRAPVFAYNGGHRAFTPGSFSNRRTEMWWGTRTRLERQRLWLPQGCEDLTADLVAPEYEIISSGRIKIETKETLLERGIKSPDFADSLILCFALDEDPEQPLVHPKMQGQDPNEVFEPLLVGDDQFDQLPQGF